MNASEMKGETNQVKNFLFVILSLIYMYIKKNTAATPPPPLAPLSQHVVKTCLSLSVGKVQIQTLNHRKNYSTCQNAFLRRLHIQKKKLFKIS
jgi:hypothetical protein